MLPNQALQKHFDSPNPKLGANRLNQGFAQFMAQHYAARHPQREQIFALLSQLSARQNQGHSCMTIAPEDGQLLIDAGIASDGSVIKPVIIHQQRAYLQRYWHYEQRLAKQITRLALQTTTTDYSPLLDQYFAKGNAEDRQRLATDTALRKSLTIITGGPGTGKTTTVIRILALLLTTQAPPFQIALCTPTGKAAMRLQESIQKQIQDLPLADDLKARIPLQVSTLHELLGARPPSPYFKHNASNPLAHDLVVIDETSMVDLALMSKLLDALKPNARLILLGDRQQLASVETGAVLAELTESLPDNTVELTHTHRFTGVIKALADAINQQDSDLAGQLLDNQQSDAQFLSDDINAFVHEHYQAYFDALQQTDQTKNIFAAFNRFRVLCSNRYGVNSASDINQRVERAFKNNAGIDAQQLWYVGKPVIMTTNRPQLKLYNGDLGICLPHPEHQQQLAIALQNSDGSLRWLHSSQLPEHELAYAMTIHKSQGSEFEQVLIVLPKTINPVLSKELLYTAVTRAKQQVTIAADQAVFAYCIQQQAQRDSGLAEQIRHFGNPHEIQ